jgi:hypothetical protein
MTISGMSAASNVQFFGLDYKTELNPLPFIMNIECEICKSTAEAVRFVFDGFIVKNLIFKSIDLLCPYVISPLIHYEAKECSIMKS